MEVKDILKTLRKTSKLSQSELANKLGVGQATVCQWEMGTAKPTCEGIIYMVSADFILGINEDMHGSALSDEHDELIARYDNLTNAQKYLIIEIMKQMKDL